MTIAAIIEPMTLLGSELRRALQSHKESYSEIRALTFDTEAIGAVTEVGDKPALVQLAEKESLEGVELVFDCGHSASTAALANDLSEGVVTILIDPRDRPESSVSVVAGVNLSASMESNLLVSPDAATILLAHLLAPLSDLQVDRVDGHLLMPASARGQEALDELFNQTRAILAMNRDRPEAIFGAQLAFNLLPIDLNSDDQAQLLTDILGSSIDLNLAATQAGVFHSLSASILVRLRRKGSTEDVLERLLQSHYLELADKPETLGPVDAASSERILFSPPTWSDPRRESFRIWSVMDNLTRGGALNALSIAEYILMNRN